MMPNINFDYAMSIVKNGNSEEIEDFMRDLPQTIQSVQTIYAMREKALELCKNGEIVMERMKLFFARDNQLELFEPIAMPQGLYLKFSHLEDSVAGVFSFNEIKKDTILGPYIGVDVYDINEDRDRVFSWEIYMNNHYHHCISGEEVNKSNWMRFVNQIDQTDLQNLEAFQKDFKIYYRAIKDIPPCTEFFVWYSLNYNQETHQSDILKEKSHKCELCPMAFRKAGDLVTHIRTHTGERPYHCDQCNSTFSRIGHLSRHKRIHSGYKPFKCDFCLKNFNDKHCMLQHRRIHTGETPYKCGACHKRYVHLNTFSNHNCMENRSRIKQCDYCVKKFVHMASLKKHLSTHLQEFPFQCSSCNKMFSTSSLLDAHECDANVEKLYACDICRQNYKDYKALKLHKCPQDDFKKDDGLIDLKTEEILERLQLKNESTMHELLEKYRGKKLCNVGKTYKIHKQVNNLHSNNHLPNCFRNKGYMCYFCNYATSKNSDFKGHLRIHTGEKPFECKLCDSRFGRRSHLIRHNRLHTGEKPHKCDYCSRLFNENHHLQEHRRTHTGEKPYKCILCQKCFAARSSWKTHKCPHAVKNKNEVCYLKIISATDPHLKLSEQSALVLSVEKKEMKKRDEEKDKERRVASVAPYLCDLCGFFTNKKSHFERHSKRVHAAQRFIEFDSNNKVSVKLEKFQCNLCSYFTDNKDTFNDHLSLDHDQKIF